MECFVIDEVAYLFAEVFDEQYGFLTDRTEVKRIRKAVDDGEDGLYAVVASVFGERLDSAFASAAFRAMDYIAYVDETWTPKDDDEKARMLELEFLHVESLKVLLRIAQRYSCDATDQIKDRLAEAENHYQHLRDRRVRGKGIQ